MRYALAARYRHGLSCPFAEAQISFFLLLIQWCFQEGVFPWSAARPMWIQHSHDFPILCVMCTRNACTRKSYSSLLRLFFCRPGCFPPLGLCRLCSLGGGNQLLLFTHLGDMLLWSWASVQQQRRAARQTAVTSNAAMLSRAECPALASDGRPKAAHGRPLPARPGQPTAGGLPPRPLPSRSDSWALSPNTFYISSPGREAPWHILLTGKKSTGGLFQALPPGARP